MASLQEADATLAAGAPLLRLAEPALLLQLLALAALGAAVGNGDPLDAKGVRGGFIADREGAFVGGHQVRHARELLFMDGERGQQQVHVAGARVIDGVVSDDLPFGFLDLHHLAELGGLGRFAFADDFGVGLEQAHQFARAARIAVDDALAGLPHDLLHARDHGLQILALRLQLRLRKDAGAALNAAGHLAREALGLPEHAPGDDQQLAVTLRQALLALLAATATRPTDVHQAMTHAPRALAQLGAYVTGEFRDGFHGPREHPDPVAQ